MLFEGSGNISYLIEGWEKKLTGRGRTVRKSL